MVTPPAGFEHIVWTYGMRRMAVLVGQALKFGEPVLLVGDTGGSYRESLKGLRFGVRCLKMSTSVVLYN